jgi:recombination endonuclease VII
MTKFSKCRRGHVLAGDNLYVSPKGVRQCRTCTSAYRKAHPTCRMKSTAAYKKWKASHPEQAKKLQKKYDLKKHFGITLDWHEAKRKEQNNQCAICKRLMDVPRVDHDHETEQVRDLLCNNCNCGIGFLQDSPIVAQATADYLKRWKHEQS